MILHLESRQSDLATYQNKAENCSLTITSDLEITFISNPPAGIKNNSDPRKLQKISNSNNYIIEGTTAILAVLSFNRLKIIQ